MIRAWSGGAPGEDHVLVRVDACVAGGAELRALQDGGEITPGGAAVGVVETAGANASDLTGARVVVGPIDPCGECEACRRGHTDVCPDRAFRGDTVDGALCTHVVAAARWVCRIDGDLAVPGPAAALLGREAAVAYAMYTRLGVAPGDRIAVIGDGAIGAFVEQIANARGATVVHASDAGAGVRVFETTGGVAGRALAIAALRPAARLAVVAPAITGASAIDALPASRLLETGTTVVPVGAAHPDLLPELTAMAIKGEIDLAACAEIIESTDLADLESRVHAGEHTGTVPVLKLRAKS